MPAALFEGGDPVAWLRASARPRRAVRPTSESEKRKTPSAAAREECETGPE